MSAQWLEVVAPIVRQAGKEVRRRFLDGRVSASRKGGGEWVTEVDRATEAFIVDSLLRYFPDHSVLGEEGGLRGESGDGNEGEHCWVIDPLDGTTNFVHGYPHFAVSVAYCRRGKPQLAVIYEVMTDMLYTATSGGGAFREDQRLRVSGETAFGGALFLASGQVNDHNLWDLLVKFSRQSDGLRKTGSSVLDMTRLAAGSVDAVVSGPVNYWDIAASGLLVREAGGLISDIHDNTEFAFGERTACFVAATPKIFTRFFAEVKKGSRGAAAEKAGA